MTLIQFCECKPDEMRCPCTIYHPRIHEWYIYRQLVNVGIYLIHGCLWDRIVDDCGVGWVYRTGESACVDVVKMADAYRCPPPKTM